MNPRTIALLIFAATMRASYGQTAPATPAPEAVPESVAPPTPSAGIIDVKPVGAVALQNLSCSIALPVAAKPEAAPTALNVVTAETQAADREAREARLKALRQRRQALWAEISDLKSKVAEVGRESTAEDYVKERPELATLQSTIDERCKEVDQVEGEMREVEKDLPLSSGAPGAKSMTLVGPDGEKKIPVLGDLPVIGRLFRSQGTENPYDRTLAQRYREAQIYAPKLGDVGQRKVTLHRDGVDAMDALTDLLKVANASYVIGDGGQRGRKVSVHFNDTPLEDGLGAVAEAAGLSYHLRGNVIIFSPNAAGFSFTKIESMSPVNDPNLILTDPFNGGGYFARPEYEAKPFGIRPEGAFDRKNYIDRKGGIRYPGPEGFFDKGPFLKPGIENREAVRKRMRIQLRNATAGNVMKRMRQFLPAPKWGDGYWAPGKGVKDPSQLLRVEGDPSGRTLDIEGTPEAVDAFVKAANELDRTANEPQRQLR